jgi:hypothetical protein
MKTLTKHRRPGSGHVKKKKIAVAVVRDLKQERRRAAQGLLAACVAIILFVIVLFLLAPLLTREKVITVDMDGRVAITDHAEKYSRVLE